MPYIDPASRASVPALGPESGGELAYLLTTEVDLFLTRDGMPDYARMTEARGALHATLQELEDRIIRPYEDRKAYENGDVFSEDLLRYAEGDNLEPD